MKSRFRFGAVVALWTLAIPLGRAQGVPAERTFPQSKPVVEAALRQLQSSTGGRLPVLDGFAVPAGSTPRPFSEGLLPMRSSGELDSGGRIAGARQRQNHSLVQRARGSEIRLSGSCLQWPSGI